MPENVDDSLFISKDKFDFERLHELILAEKRHLDETCLNLANEIARNKK
jgi:hypothetical protein